MRARPCSVPWCTDHPKNPARVLIHHAVLGTANGTGHATVELFQGDDHDPVLRVFHLIDGQERTLELPPALAVDLAALLSGVSTTGLWELATALAKAEVASGP